MIDTKIQWDQTTLKFDTLRYNFNLWALDIAKTICPDVEDLEKLHIHVSPFDLSRIKKEFHKKCNERHFMEMIDKFMEEYSPPLIGNKKYLIQRNPTLRIVEPNQSNNGRRLYFHKGTWVGNGSGLRTVWMPFTRTFDSNTMLMIDFKTSNELSQKCVNEQWSLEKFESECVKNSFPVNLKSSAFNVSISAPFLPITKPGLAVHIVISIFSLILRILINEVPTQAGFFIK